MADVLNPEQTESAPLNTELETPTLDVPADHFGPSDELTHNPQAKAAAAPQRFTLVGYSMGGRIGILRPRASC